MAKAFGRADIALATYEGVILTDTAEEFERKVRTRVVDDVIAGLSAASETAAQERSGVDTGAVFSGDLDAVHEYFLERQWSDGLPIIPPTRDRVERFLSHTDRDPNQSLGVLLPEGREASILTVAVNGVMAGCRPEYMPLLVAAAEAIADSRYRIQDAGSTPGWEPLVIISGPGADDLGFSHGTAVLRTGRQPNSSLGRFVKLLIQNVAGLRPPPGTTDKGTIGVGFNHVALAEDSASTLSVGWPTFGVEQGFDSADTVVTLQSVVAVSVPIYSAGSSAVDHLEQLADLVGATARGWVHTGVRLGGWFPLLVISPSVARILSGDGYTKETVRNYLHDHAEMPMSDLIRYGRPGAGVDLRDFLRPGQVPDEYVYVNEESEAKSVSLFPYHEQLGIVVAGDPDRNQSRALINNHIQGAPVSRRVEWSKNSHPHH